MTNEIQVATAAEARDLTDKIKFAVEGAWQLIKQAYISRAWAALGYESWDDYCTREFGTCRLRLPREERREVVASLREIGMSTRAIASATGDSVGTVHAELSSGVQNRTPDQQSVTEELRTVAAKPGLGLDGKTYPQTQQPARPAPKPRTDVVATISRALRRAEEAAQAADEITRQHLIGRKEEAATWGRSLDKSMQSLQRLLDSLREAQ